MENRIKTITEEKRKELISLSKFFTHIARNENGDLWAHDSEPYKIRNQWDIEEGLLSSVCSEFEEMKWTDEKAVLIEDLLKLPVEN